MEKREFNQAMEESVQKKLLEEPDYWWKRRRSRWDEWDSPVGLGLAWTLFILPIGIFLWLLHMAGLIK